ncbi:MAG: hypothetical protein M3N32_04300 [Actinomycetota bacterium]|nr:hypothetical protein [Actinomycetota bacterium]
MPETYTSLMALVVDRPVDNVGAVVEAARHSGEVDRNAPIGNPQEAQEVLWGGRMQKAVVRSVEGADGAPMLRAETYIGGEGLKHGMRRHAQLLRGLAHALPDRVEAVRDLSAAIDRDREWLERVAAGHVEQRDAITVHDEGQGTLWVHTHGAARFDVPDLELYGLTRSQVESAEQLLDHLHAQLLRGGLRAELRLEDSTPVHLVPALEAWPHLPLDWPGVGRAGEPRVGHEGPRATVSITHRPRFGRYRKDLRGVLKRLPKTG